MSTPENDEKQSTDPASQAALERGKECWANKDYDSAVREFTEVIRLDPDCADAYFRRGWAHNCNDDNDNAIKDCTVAIRLDPGNAGAYAVRAGSYLGKEDYDNVITDCTEAIRLSPNYGAAYYLRAEAYREKGDYDNSIKDCSERIRLSYNLPDAYLDRAAAYHGKDDYDSAIKDCTWAIKRFPDFEGAFCCRADAWHEKKQYAKAISDYTRAIMIAPDYTYACERRDLAVKSAEAVEKAGRKTAKKVIALSVLFLLAALSVHSLLRPALPQTPSPNYGWFTADSKADTFRVSTAEELAGLSAMVNDFRWKIKPFDLKTAKIKPSDFKDKTVILADDIDLSDYCRKNWYFAHTDEGRKKVNGWIPVGSGKFAFRGTFDGNGKTISGLHVDSSESFTGLFGEVGGAVKNLTVNGEKITIDNFADYEAPPKKGFMGRLMHMLSLDMLRFTLGILLGIVLGFTVHEYCHALCAKKFGDNTAFYLGRITLNPAKHFSPLGILCLVVIGIGWAKPVPVLPQNLRKPRRHMALLAAAGPLSNLVIGVMLASYLKAVYYYDYHHDIHNNFFSTSFTDVIWWAAMINFTMFILNLLPLPPLDGGHIALAALNLKSNIEEWVRIIGAVVLLLFVITVIGQDFIGLTIIPFFDVVASMVTLVLNIGAG